MMLHCFQHCSRSCFAEGICQHVCKAKRPFQQAFPLCLEKSMKRFQLKSFTIVDNKNMFLHWYLLTHGIIVFDQTCGSSPFLGL